MIHLLNEFRINIVIAVNKNNVLSMTNLDSSISSVRKSTICFVRHYDSSITFTPLIAERARVIRGSIINKNDLCGNIEA